MSAWGEAYLEDVLFDAEVESDRSLERADEDAHPKFKGLVEALAHCLVLHAVEHREGLHQLQHQVQQLLPHRLRQLGVREHLEQILQQQRGQPVERQVRVGLRVWRFLEQMQEELDACVHDGHIVRAAPFHQLAQRLQPRLQRVRLKHLPDQQGQSGNATQTGVEGHHRREQTRSDFLRGC